MNPRLLLATVTAAALVLVAGTYASAEQGRTLEFPPDGLDDFVPAVARGAWEPRGR